MKPFAWMERAFPRATGEHAVGPDGATSPPRRSTTIAGVTGFTLGIGVLALVAAIPKPDAAPSPPTTEETRAAPADPYDFTYGFSAVAEATIPGVVRIEVTRSGEGRAATVVPPGFERFFQPRGRAPSQPQRSGGTGFVIDEGGHILTNHHVVDDAQEITVWLHDERSFEAGLMGSDPTTDVAVLEIDAEGLVPLPIGDSDAVRVGEWVVAFGNPGFRGRGALEETVTAGIVSAVGRPLTLIRSELAQDPDSRNIAEWAIEDFIQTDAVINPGNSGGPLVDIHGRVIGINTAIMSASGYYQGYGFAVPANLAMGVAEDLIEDGRVRRGWVGLRITNVTAEDAEALGLDRIGGVLVQGVTDGGPAARAGLEFGDVVVDIEGRPVDRVGALQQRIARLDPGDRVELGVVRDGRHRVLEVTLGEAPISEGATSPTLASRDPGMVGGASFQELDESEAQRFGWDRGGVFATRVDPTGSAARRGVSAGSRVVSANGVETGEIGDLVRVLDAVEPGDVVSLILEGPEGNRWMANIRAETPPSSDGRR